MAYALISPRAWRMSWSRWCGYDPASRWRCFITHLPAVWPVSFQRWRRVRSNSSSVVLKACSRSSPSRAPVLPSPPMPPSGCYLTQVARKKAVSEIYFGRGTENVDHDSCFWLCLLSIFGWHSFISLYGSWCPWLMDWMIDGLVDWLIDWLIDWFIHSFIHSTNAVALVRRWCSGDLGFSELRSFRLAFSFSYDKIQRHSWLCGV